MRAKLRQICGEDESADEYELIHPLNVKQIQLQTAFPVSNLAADGSRGLTW